MNADFRESLLRCDVDVDEAVYRLAGDEKLYINCLSAFLEDKTMAELDCALLEQAWDDAFTAAHALKGVAGNMSFVALFHATAELVVYIRGGRIDEVKSSYVKVRRCYDEITDVIRRNCDTENENEKEGE